MSAIFATQLQALKSALCSTECAALVCPVGKAVFATVFRTEHAAIVKALLTAKLSAKWPTNLPAEFAPNVAAFESTF